MFYPLIVLFFSGALSVFLTVVLMQVAGMLGLDTEELFEGEPLTRVHALGWLSLWIPLIVIGLLLMATVAGLGVPRLRRYLRWRLPAFREANLSQAASALHLMLHGGSTLVDALALLMRLEQDTPAAEELAVWQQNLLAGHSKFIEIAVPGKIFPPLFVWIVVNADEDLAEGFRRAADIYHARALYRIEMFLYAALPAAVMLLGLLVLSQAYGMTSVLIHWMRVITLY